MPIAYTSRGFADYAHFIDSHRATVTVRESSAAEYDAVWIFIDHEVESDELTADHAGAHLNAEQAKVVIAALQEWLDGIA